MYKHLGTKIKSLIRVKGQGDFRHSNIQNQKKMEQKFRERELGSQEYYLIKLLFKYKGNNFLSYSNSNSSNLMGFSKD